MIITIEKETLFNHEKIKVGVIEDRKITTADFYYLTTDRKVKVIQNPKILSNGKII